MPPKIKNEFAFWNFTFNFNLFIDNLVKLIVLLYLLKLIV